MQLVGAEDRRQTRDVLAIVLGHWWAAYHGCLCVCGASDGLQMSGRGRCVAYESGLVEARELEEQLALHLQSLGRGRYMVDEGA